MYTPLPLHTPLSATLQLPRFWPQAENKDGYTQTYFHFKDLVEEKAVLWLCSAASLAGASSSPLVQASSPFPPSTGTAAAAGGQREYPSWILQPGVKKASKLK